MSRVMDVAQQITSLFTPQSDVHSAWITGDITEISPLEDQYASVPTGKKLVAIAPGNIEFGLPLLGQETSPELISTDKYQYDILALSRFVYSTPVYFLEQKANLLEWCQKIILGWQLKILRKEIQQPASCIITLAEIVNPKIPLDSPLTKQGWLSAELSVIVTVNYPI